MGNFSNYWDLTTLFTKLKNKLKSISDKIDDSVSLKTATGNPITLTDAANANAEELSMTIEPIQSGSGDPSPTNVRPISGLTSGEVTRTGKNLFSIDSNRIDKDYDDEPNVRRFFQTIPLPKGTYTWKFNGTMSGLAEITCGVADVMLPFSNINIHTSRRALTDQSPTNTITITDEYGYAFIGFMKLSGVLTLAEIELTKVQLELGSTATDYEAPVTPATATITFGQTVYGGSVNFKTGEVTVTHGMVDLGTLEWFKQNTASSNWRFYADLDSFKHADVGELCGFLCSTYREVTAGQTWLGITGVSGNGLTSNSICVCDMTYTDATAFKTAMSGVQLCYELATPTTLTLTPAELELLKDNNTIAANGAEISLSYYPDNAIGVLAGRVDDKADITYVDNAVATKANITDVNTALAGKANQTTVTIPEFIPSQAGWRRICKIKPVGGNTIGGTIYVGGRYHGARPLSTSVAVNTVYTTASLTLLSSNLIPTDNIVRFMRLIYADSSAYWLDVYVNNASSALGPLTLTFTGDIAVSDIQNPISITTDATAVTDEISLNQKVSGTVLTDKSLETKYLHYISIQRYNESDNFPTYDVLIPIVNNTAATMTKTEILAYLDEHGHIKPLHGMYIYRTNGNITSAEPVVDFVYSYYEGSEDKQLIFYRFEHDEHTLTTDASNLRIEDRFVVQIVQNA